MDANRDAGRRGATLDEPYVIKLCRRALCDEIRTWDSGHSRAARGSGQRAAPRHDATCLIVSCGACGVWSDHTKIKNVLT